MFLIANWEQNSTLAHYTQYKPSELCDCVKALHRLLSVGLASNLPAIREKYSQHKVTGFGPLFFSIGRTVADVNAIHFLSSVQICREEALSIINSY